MSLKIWILLICGFAIYLRSSAQLCVRRYVDGKWISKGNCGGPGRMSEIQKELQLEAEDEKKPIADKKWTVFQRRIHGNVDFYRGWDDYKKGFGDCEGDLWLGLEELHNRTKNGDMELEINMIRKDHGIHWVVKYRNFRISSGTDNYRLHVSDYSGNATGDGLFWHNNQQFTTKDADHDSHSHGNCASIHEGGWWYTSCHHSNLNGNFNKTGNKGVYWYGSNNLLRFSEMKLRKRS